MGPRNAYKDMLDNVVSPITCVSMNPQNQLEQMANGAMFATNTYADDLCSLRPIKSAILAFEKNLTKNAILKNRSNYLLN
jgi:hypothetical protein